MEAGSIEIAFARLDEQVKGFKGPFDQLVSDQRKLTEAVQQLTQNNQTLSIIKSDVHDLKTEQEKMRAEYRAIDSARIETEKARIDAELKKKNQWFFEFGKTAISVGVMLALYHFGVKPL
jgi:uncharacterized protein (DUF3084 family)